MTIGRANLAEACSGLLAAKQRTALALIGIAIGVASVSSMISVGNIVRAEAVRQFQQLGTDIVNVRLRSRDRRRGRVSVKLSDAEGIVTLPAIREAAPYTIASQRVVLGGATTQLSRVVGATDALVDLIRLEVAAGRFVSRLDGAQHFCTVGDDIAQALRRAGGDDVVGATVRIGETVFTIVGALRRAALGQRPFNANKAVFIPIETAARVTHNETLRDVLARMSPGTHYREATRQIRAYFSSRTPQARVQVRSAEELIEQMHGQMRLYTMLLGAIGGIALLVGGIGVMNVMLVAVAERKTEIGIRRALGARRRDIQAQFLAEAMILSLLGGVVGVTLGVAATYGICQFTGWAFTVSANGTLLGTVVAGCAGVFFGFYPARQAAKLHPVGALQGG
ncbi:MAG: ABC transporter permease [Deltaproteobacteria bacterium]|nr:ABC transporter permease [Deltaproteobacteria bacterium]